MQTLKLSVLKDMYFQLPKYAVIAKVNIGEWEYTRGEFLGEEGYKYDADFKSTIKTGDRWFPTYDSAHFFKASVTVPEEMDGLPLHARFKVGGEALVKCNGVHMAGCTSRLTLPDRADFELGVHKAGEVLNFEIEATVDSMEFCDPAMDGAEYQVCDFGETSIFVTDAECEGYIFDLEVAFDALDYISDEHIKSRVYSAIDDSLHIVDYDFEPNEVRKSVRRAREHYLKMISDIKWSAQSRVMLTGHSHIDVAWLWRVQESIRKSARTFSNVTNLMDHYPEMTFGQSEAVLYDMMKRHYPDIYEKMKKKIADGQWDICGNVWVEADTNITSGESLIRQVLYGTEFFKKEFGKVSKTYWLPDCFGFTAALPQIIKGCGMENFITSKLSFNDTTKFPYHMFMWQGNNGDKVYAHLMLPSYNCNFKVGEIMTADRECNDKNILDTSMSMYGFGDGGGGPTRNMLERGRRLRSFPGLPKTEIGHIDDFFMTYHGKENDLPVWNGEMYYENHRGTFTSQAFVKKNNRKGEIGITRAEMLSSFAEIKNGKEYPKERLEAAWRTLMTNQFHDILPGSSIHQVFEDCRKTYAEMNDIRSDLTDEALSSLTQYKEDSVIVYNLSSFAHTGPVTVKGVPEGKYPANSDGKVLRSVNKNGELIFLPEEIAPMSCKVFSLVTEQPTFDCVKAGKTELSNGIITAALDENAILTSVRLGDREALDGRGNILTVSLDKCCHETAWNLELNYTKKMWELKDAESVEVLESNPLRGVIRVKRRFNKSLIMQDIILYAGLDYIIFDTTVDWHETDKVLKAGFDVSVIDTDATYDIAHGTVKRPTHWNTPYDKTRFEVAAHKWADLSEGGFGCSILNDCKYGYDIHDSHMRITLMRAPTCPDRTGDHGINTFKYAFLPHFSDWRSRTVEAANDFNIDCPTVYNGGMSERKEERFIETSGGEVVIDAFKKAQDGRGYILRLVEATQSRGSVTVKFGFDISSVVECNMIEEDKNTVPHSDNSFTFSTKPFEVKTYRIII